MANKQIVLNIESNITDALIQSQNKRLAALEALIKKKAKKTDVSIEMRYLNTLKEMIAANNKQSEKKNNALLEALEKSNSRPFTAQIVPNPA